jgi:hypothetical protein
MGQSLVKNYLHIVFSTKYRQPVIIESLAIMIMYISFVCFQKKLH